jgi:hypothetical protein
MIDYSNPQGFGATAAGMGAANPAGQQRDAITMALMNVANPPPRTQVPQGAPMQGQRPDLSRPPNVLGAPPPGGMPPPGASMNAAASMPGAQPGGLMNQAGIAPARTGPPPPVLPPAPGTGLPQGPMPNVPGLVGQQPQMPQPGTQIPLPGTNPGGY